MRYVVKASGIAASPDDRGRVAAATPARMSDLLVATSGTAFPACRFAHAGYGAADCQRRTGSLQQHDRSPAPLARRAATRCAPINRLRDARQVQVRIGRPGAAMKDGKPCRVVVEQGQRAADRAVRQTGHPLRMSGRRAGRRRSVRLWPPGSVPASRGSGKSPPAAATLRFAPATG